MAVYLISGIRPQVNFPSSFSRQRLWANDMNTTVTFFATSILLAVTVHAAEPAYPDDISQLIERRELCDHFRFAGKTRRPGRADE